jgi:hypothetical protein
MDLAGTPMLRLTAPSRRGARHELFKANTLSAGAGISVLVHTAAFAALLMQEVAPYSPPRLEVVEITLVPAEVLDGARANSASEAIPGDNSVEALTQSFLSLTHPDMAARAPSPDWPGGINAGRAFDLPFDLPMSDAFRPRTPAPALGALADQLDCFAAGTSKRDASAPSRRVHSPCASDDPRLRAHATMPSPTYAWVAGEVGADNDYRTFKTIQPIFDESLFPDKVPDANRAFKGWFRGLFR